MTEYDHTYLDEKIILGPNCDSDTLPVEFHPRHKKIRKFSVRGGSVTLVELIGGTLGFSASGDRATATLNALSRTHSSLEIYQILGGDRADAPARLLNEHAFRYAGNQGGGDGSHLPGIDDVIILGPPAGGGTPSESKLGQIAGAGCVEGSLPAAEYFDDWFNGLFYIPGIGTLANLGANGVHGNGQWDQGNVNITLLPTTAGCLVVCFDGEAGYSPSDALITVEIGLFHSPGSWVPIWSSHSWYTGAVYGFWFKQSSVIERVRMTIRDNGDNIGKPFNWGASY